VPGRLQKCSRLFLFFRPHLRSAANTKPPCGASPHTIPHRRPQALLCRKKTPENRRRPFAPAAHCCRQCCKNLKGIIYTKPLKASCLAAKKAYHQHVTRQTGPPAPPSGGSPHSLPAVPFPAAANTFRPGSPSDNRRWRHRITHVAQHRQQN
jgi:hypothetical protein